MLHRPKRLIARLLSFALDRRLPPPSKQELLLVRELQDAFRLSPPVDSADAPPSQAVWLNNLNRIRELVLNNDPREFLRWDVVQDSMFVASAPYLGKELAFLKKSPRWASRWRQAIQESPVGH